MITVVNTLEQPPVYKFKCPSCGKHEFSVAHLFPSKWDNYKWGNWYCDNEDCGRAVHGHVHINGTFDYHTVPNTRKVKTKALLRLDAATPSPIHIVVDHFQTLMNDEQVTADHSEYWFNEHTCPWNYLRFHIAEGDDTDPHGIFYLVDEVDYKKVKDLAKTLNLDSPSEVFDDFANWKILFPSMEVKND